VALFGWIMMGIAIWHFTVFLPDRFWQGIVGALLGAASGAILSGALIQIAAGRAIGETDIGTALAAVPGALIGIAVVYAIGARQERMQLERI
jgi:membrane protein DedA with SNARE-associated domain